MMKSNSLSVDVAAPTQQGVMQSGKPSKSKPQGLFQKLLATLQSGVSNQATKHGLSQEDNPKSLTSMSEKVGTSTFKKEDANLKNGKEVVPEFSSPDLPMTLEQPAANVQVAPIIKLEANLTVKTTGNSQNETTKKTMGSLNLNHPVDVLSKKEANIELTQQAGVPNSSKATVTTLGEAQKNTSSAAVKPSPNANINLSNLASPSNLDKALNSSLVASTQSSIISTHQSNVLQTNISNKLANEQQASLPPLSEKNTTLTNAVKPTETMVNSKDGQLIAEPRNQNKRDLKVSTEHKGQPNESIILINREAAISKKEEAILDQRASAIQPTSTKQRSQLPPQEASINTPANSLLNQKNIGASSGFTQQDFSSGQQDFNPTMLEGNKAETRGKGFDFQAHLAYKPQRAFTPADTMLEIVKSAKNGSTSLELQLEPANLGKVQVSIQLDAAKHIQVAFTVDQQASRQALEQHMPQLRLALAQQGLDLGGFSMQMNQQQQEQHTSSKHHVASEHDMLDGIHTETSEQHKVGVNIATDGHLHILA